LQTEVVKNFAETNAAPLSRIQICKLYRHAIYGNQNGREAVIRKNIFTEIIWLRKQTYKVVASLCLDFLCIYSE